jgi:ComF family protein
MWIADQTRRAGEALISLFFPPHCANCGVSTESGAHLCAGCGEDVRRIVAPFCERCSEPFSGAVSGSFVCSNCADRQLHFGCAVAPYLSRGVVREFIHRFKYDRERYLRIPLGEWLSEALEDDRLKLQPADFLVPVPLHSTRFRERGFNQADLLADQLSRTSNTPVLRCLHRTRYTTTQTRLDRHERMENLRDAFRVVHPERLLQRHLLLVDDVFTTGSTADECARVLLISGAASVRVVTVARG